jgi:hypothetical protein
MFEKRVSEWTLPEIEQIWLQKWAESSSIELKGQIPSENGESDRWITKGDRIGDYAKQKLLREIVAFANAQGGTLFLGIEESKEKPARAAKPNPILRCKEFAERFRRILRDDIEPRLPMAECEGIPLQNDDGLVVVRVPPSATGPHWVRPTRDPTYRRGDEAITMSMTEVQDLTLRLTRAADERALQLEKAQADFLTEFDTAYSGYLFELEKQFAGRQITKCCIGVRCTALPLVPIQIDKVATREQFRATKFPQVVIETSDGKHGELIFPRDWDSTNWRPNLRSTKTEHHSDYGRFKRSVDWQGRVDISWIRGNSTGTLYLSWLLYTVALIMLHVDQVREAALVLDAPYALDIQVRALGDVIAGWNDSHMSIDRLPPFMNFPTLEFSNEQRYNELLRLVQYDYWTAAGVQNPRILNTYFP